MIIVTWNINSVRVRLGLLKNLVDIYQPEMIFLQETKVEDHLFPDTVIKDLGYQYLFYCGQKSYNGVAVLSKIPFESCFALALYNDDKRHLAVRVKDLEIHNFYVPAGGDLPDIQQNPKFKHKLAYINLIEQWLLTNRTTSHQLILLGDFNIAPNHHDVWSSYQLRHVVSHTDIERQLLIKLQDSLNFIDSARHFVDLKIKYYTWWSYRNLDWQRSNRGRRLDHIWVSQNLQPQMNSVRVASEARSWLRPSDHAPYILDIDVN